MRTREPASMVTSSKSRRAPNPASSINGGSLGPSAPRYRLYRYPGWSTNSTSHRLRTFMLRSGEEIVKGLLLHRRKARQLLHVLLVAHLCVRLRRRRLLLDAGDLCLPAVL